MKKKLSAILLSCALASTVGGLYFSSGNVTARAAGSNIENGAPTVPLRGDYNGDNVVDAADLLYLRRSLAGWGEYALEVNSSNDVDGDGLISGKDVTLLKRYLAEWEGVHLEEQYTDGLQFTLNSDGTYTVSGFLFLTAGGKSASAAEEGLKIVIPSYYHGVPVTGVSKELFETLPDITELVVGDNVKQLPEEVSLLSSLTSLTLGSSMEAIDLSTFEHLTEVVVSGNNETLSSENGVLFDKDKTELKAYPKAKTEESYTIPQTVTKVCDGAFSGNTSLTSITIPETVTEISASAFEGLESLETVNFAGSAEAWEELVGNNPIFESITLVPDFKIDDGNVKDEDIFGDDDEISDGEEDPDKDKGDDDIFGDDDDLLGEKDGDKDILGEEDKISE